MFQEKQYIILNLKPLIRDGGLVLEQESWSMTEMLLLNGRTINQIADEYHLSIETIKKLSTLNK